VDPTELGSSWSKAFTNLQDALASAKAGDEIWVTEGTYLPTEGTTFQSGYEREQSFRLVDGVSLYGGFKGFEASRFFRQGDTNQTILSGEIHDNPTYWSLHVITGHELTSDIIIDGFRIEKGNANGVLNQLTDANQTVNIWGVGAGIFLWESSGDLKIDNCVFTQNYSIPEHGNGDGSCIYINAKSESNFEVKISNTKFIENYSDGSLFQLNGTAIDVGQLSFANVDFLNNNGDCVNVVGRESSRKTSSIGQLSFANVDFLNNYGNSIEMNARSVSRNSRRTGGILNATFSNCRFIQNQDDETINFELQKAEFENCTFQKNGAKTILKLEYPDPSNDDNLQEIILNNVQFSENNGTSLDAPRYTKVIVSDSQFEGNNGSAIKAEYQVVVTNSIFQDLKESAIHVEDPAKKGQPCYVEVRSSSFINNHSSKNGGAIFCTTINVANIIFRENYAEKAGGAIYLEPGSLSFGDFEEYERPVEHIHNCIFDSNIAGFEGGGVNSFGNSIRHFNLTPIGRSYAYLVNISNSIFFGNEAERGGAFSGFGTLINCTLVQNSAYASASVFAPVSTDYRIAYTALTNCILWDNRNVFNPKDKHGIWNEWNLGNQFQSLPVYFRIPRYPGDPLASAVNGEGNLEELIQIYFDNNNSTPILAQNWTDNENPFQSAFSKNPLFVNQADPDGPDDIWMTGDDGLRLKEGSPAIDVGNGDFISFDGSDLDGDGIIQEDIPYDLIGNQRIFGKIDLGAYESRPGNALAGAPGWYDLSWFGSYFDNGTNWIFHQNMGKWIFVNQWTPKDLYFYLDELGWIWTSPSIYPHLYSFRNKSWIYLSTQQGKPYYYSHQRDTWYPL